MWSAAVKEGWMGCVVTFDGTLVSDVVLQQILALTTLELSEELTQLAEGNEEKARECVEGKVERDGALKEEEEKGAHKQEEGEAKL